MQSYPKPVGAFHIVSREEQGDFWTVSRPFPSLQDAKDEICGWKYQEHIHDPEGREVWNEEDGDVQNDR